ncbi:MAG: hypothetical protein SFY69_13055 [Planctomycetota bacterium]|nr:hypothetical protein [Planctomycetota bacterium]
MTDLLYLLLIVPLFFAGLIVIASWLSVRGLGSPDGRIATLDQGEVNGIAGLAAAHARFADAHGLEWSGAFRSEFPNNPRIVCCTWRSRGTGPILVAYVVNAQVYSDLVSTYANSCTLTTGSAPGGALFPTRRGKVRQILPGRSLTELWLAHAEADQHLRSELRLLPRRDDRPIDELLLESVHGVAAHVRSYPLWPLLCVWWYLTQRLRTGTPVVKQGLKAEDVVPTR